MPFITPVNISELDGESIKLESSFSSGKLLTLVDKKVYFDSENLKLKQTWNLVPTPSGILIKNEGMYVCNFPEDGGDVSFLDEYSSIEEDTLENCYWKIGKNSELYHIPPNTKEEKYLWVVNDNLHVISDGYLADRWIIHNKEKKYNDKHPTLKKSNNIYYYYIVILLCVVIFLVIFFR